MSRVEGIDTMRVILDNLPSPDCGGVKGSGMLDYDIFQHKGARSKRKVEEHGHECTLPQYSVQNRVYASCANCLKPTLRPLAADEVECIHCGQNLKFPNHNLSEKRIINNDEMKNKKIIITRLVVLTMAAPCCSY